MAQEDYLSGSKFGQVAGSLLGSKRKRDKKDFRRALLATAIFEGFGALQKQQKQSIIDGVNDVKEKYNDIFKINQEEYSAYQDQRKRLKEYQKDKDTFLNKEAKSRIDNTDIAIETGVTFDNRRSEHPILQKSLMDAFNKERKQIENEMKILEKDPRATFQSFTSYNEKAKNEYLKALKSVEDDPTKKGLIKAAFNKIFGTAPDGTPRFGLAEKAKLENDLQIAKKERNTFRERIEEANRLLKEEYDGVGSTTSELISKGLIGGRKPFTQKQIEEQTDKVLDIFIDKDGDYTKFANEPLVVETKSGNNKIASVDIFKKLRDEKLIVLDENGKASPISADLFYTSIAKRSLANNDVLIKANKDPMIGRASVQAVLQQFADEGRFNKQGSSISFILPSKDGKDMPNGIATISDIIEISQQQGKESEISELRESGYNTLDMLNKLSSDEFQSAPIEDQKVTINELKELFPSASEEIDLIADSTKLEFLKIKKDELEKISQERPGLKRFLPERWIFRLRDLGTIEDIDELIEKELSLTQN